MKLADLGPTIKAARKNAKLTQAGLAAPLGMSRATVSAIENGRCDEIGFSKLGALLEILGLELAVAPRDNRSTIDDLRKEHRER